VRFELRPIPGFPGYYADTFGDVWSIRRGRLREMTQHDAADGYRKVMLQDSRGRWRHKMVCRLVCAAFHGRAPKERVACHCNGNRTDNRPGNLRWGTRAENEADKKRHGTDPRGHRNGRAKLSPRDVRRIRKSQLTALVMAERLAVHPETIRRIRRRELWQHVNLN
jgi:hypothetical protein